ncbi:GAF domain-containing protein [Streptomyces sp. NPDC014846]|uniref:GAF domain-containing protein n=1 Tax=Streptomyces sp. NPDC014846 TaxID=3364922 RepID=UPI0036FBC2DB
MTNRSPLTMRPAADGVAVVCLSGVLDAGSCPQLARELGEHLDRAARQGRRLVLDMADVRLISSAAVTTLLRATAHLAHAPVLVAAAPGPVGSALRRPPTAGIRVYGTLADALAALAPAGPPDRSTPADGRERPAAGSDGLRGEVYGMRAKARSSAQIGIAQGILLARYDLPAASMAFALLKEGSQRYNVPLRVLASAVIAAPPPQSAAHWFPGRSTHAPAFRTEFLGAHRVHAADRRRVLAAAVDEALALSAADAAELHVTDPAQDDALLLEQHRGLDAAYRDFAALLTGPPAVCARAQRSREPVTVLDVAEDAGLSAHPAGPVLLAAGSRTVRSVPLITADGGCTGVLSLHRREPDSRLPGVRARALVALAGEVAAWRSWYRRSVVLDALDYLHQHRPAGRP